jgi:DNA-directed RNA polymerase specialized sigma24 family protein
VRRVRQIRTEYFPVRISLVSRILPEGKFVTIEPPTTPEPLDLRQSREDVRAALAVMSDHDRRKVAAIATSFARRYQLHADDLLQEAYVRALSTRSCASGVPIVAFLAGVIRSVAWDGLRERTDGALTYVPDYKEKDLAGVAARDVTPEDGALARTKYAKHLEHCLECIEDDEELQLLVEGLFDNLRGRELEELLGVDTKGLAAAKRRLTRKLESRYPAGIPL